MEVGYNILMVDDEGCEVPMDAHMPMQEEFLGHSVFKSVIVLLVFSYVMLVFKVHA
jgi:hypothetical protein